MISVNGVSYYGIRECSVAPVYVLSIEERPVEDEDAVKVVHQSEHTSLDECFLAYQLVYLDKLTDEKINCTYHSAMIWMRPMDVSIGQ